MFTVAAMLTVASLLTVATVLTAIASTSARPYLRTPINGSTLTKVRANAIASSQRPCVLLALQPPLSLTYPRISAGKLAR
jgi:hypothetical protein